MSPLPHINWRCTDKLTERYVSVPIVVDIVDCEKWTVVIRDAQYNVVIFGATPQIDDMISLTNRVNFYPRFDR